jgi:hypothetical protein
MPKDDLASLGILPVPGYLMIPTKRMRLRAYLMRVMSRLKKIPDVVHIVAPIAMVGILAAAWILFYVDHKITPLLPEGPPWHLILILSSFAAEIWVLITWHRYGCGKRLSALCARLLARMRGTGSTYLF